MPKDLNSQLKKLVASLISYFEKERDSGGPRDVLKRVADALQLHPSTVSAISKNIKEGRPLCQQPQENTAS
ncbi:hypothetical protein QE152_g8810 [Popillia japonica]|uniref:LexA repressor DNA-binding domain-containing protein n=1 Tax=Popillia japonica TaxID=7064 RepID=A0AAW1LWS0_POPJA